MKEVTFNNQTRIKGKVYQRGDVANVSDDAAALLLRAGTVSLRGEGTGGTERTGKPRPSTAMLDHNRR